jgi:hypothetical protein
MNKQEAKRILKDAAEDYEFTRDEADELFLALYGRATDDDDGDTGEVISLCYAAL